MSSLAATPPLSQHVTTIKGAMDIQKGETERSDVECEDDSGVESEKELLITRSPTRRSGGNKFVLVLTVISALGGFLFGYDTGVVSGAMLKVRETFDLSSGWIEIVVSVTIAAAAVAALIGGPLCELIGRKPVLLLASLVFTVGAIVMGVAWKAYILIIGRCIIGIGIGLAAMAVPMYIAESAPAHMRGKLVVMNVVFITGGQFIATIIDGAFSNLSGDIGWRFMLGLAGVPSVLMFTGMIFMPESPRWLVFKGKEDKARKVLFKIRRPSEVAEELSSIVRDYEEYQKSHLGCSERVCMFLTSKHILLALLVGCGLQLFQQFGGINTVMYYSASIIQMAGFSDNAAIWFSAIPGCANFVFTLVGLVLVDRIGRRVLLIGSTIGVILSLSLLSGTFLFIDHTSPDAVPYDTVNGTCQLYSCGACVANSKCGFCVDEDSIAGVFLNGTCSRGIQYANGTTYSEYRPHGEANVSLLPCAVKGENDEFYDYDDLLDSVSGYEPLNSSLVRKWTFTSCPDSRYAPLAIVALFLYIMFFAPGMGPLPWTINSEIYPTWARSYAIAIATMVNWLSNLLVSITFLTLTDTLGQPKTFGLYAGLGLFGLAFIVFLVPETKGKSLEEVDQLFQRPHCVTLCCPLPVKDPPTGKSLRQH